MTSWYLLFTIFFSLVARLALGFDAIPATPLPGHPNSIDCSTIELDEGVEDEWHYISYLNFMSQRVLCDRNGWLTTYQNKRRTCEWEDITALPGVEAVSSGHSPAQVMGGLSSINKCADPTAGYCGIPINPKSSNGWLRIYFYRYITVTAIELQQADYSVSWGFRLRLFSIQYLDSYQRGFVVYYDKDGNDVFKALESTDTSIGQNQAIRHKLQPVFRTTTINLIAEDCLGSYCRVNVAVYGCQETYFDKFYNEGTDIWYSGFNIGQEAFYLGHDLIYYLTNRPFDYDLKIDLVFKDGNRKETVVFDNFKLGETTLLQIGDMLRGNSSFSDTYTSIVEGKTIVGTYGSPIGNWNECSHNFGPNWYISTTDCWGPLKHNIAEWKNNLLNYVAYRIRPKRVKSREIRPIASTNPRGRTIEAETYGTLITKGKAPAVISYARDDDPLTCLRLGNNEQLVVELEMPRYRPLVGEVLLRLVGQHLHRVFAGGNYEPKNSLDAGWIEATEIQPDRIELKGDLNCTEANPCPSVTVTVENDRELLDAERPIFLCEVQLSPCAYIHACANGGSCRFDIGAAADDYQCDCAPGFTGPLCESVIY